MRVQVRGAMFHFGGILLLCTALVVGCSDDSGPGPDAGLADGAPAGEALPPDAGPPDQQVAPDTLRPDAAPTFPADPYQGLNKVNTGPDIYWGSGTFGDKQGQLVLWVPPAYTPAKAWPLSVVLHGGGNTTGNKESQVSALNLLKSLVSKSQSEQMIWLAGVIRKAGSWHAWVVKDNTVDLVDAVREVSRRFHVDGRRVYLTGVSMGGGGTASISWMLPRAFAAFGPVAGYYWNTWGKVPDLKGVSYRVVHGALDKVPEQPYDRLKLAEAFVKICTTAGATVDKVILPGVGHAYPGSQVPLMSAFLLKHKNSQPTDWVKARQAVLSY